LARSCSSTPPSCSPTGARTFANNAKKSIRPLAAVEESIFLQEVQKDLGDLQRRIDNRIAALR
jgi:hypothetical protein